VRTFNLEITNNKLILKVMITQTLSENDTHLRLHLVTRVNLP